MARDKTMNDYLGYIFWIVSTLFIIIFFGAMIYNMMTPETPNTYKFEVTGVISEANATTAASLHLECVKYCIDRVTNDYGYKLECMKECQTIGQEGCSK
jgi:hypothetical protein